MLARLSILAVLAALLVPASAGAQATATSSAVADAVDQLQTDTVFVAEGNEAGVTAADADRIRAEIRAKGEGPIYVAVFAAGTGEPLSLAGTLARRLGQAGVYAVIAGPAGRSFAGGQAGATGLRPGVAPQLATDALNAKRDDGATAILLDYVDRVGAARSNGGEPASDGGGSGAGILAVIGALVLGGGLFAFWTARKRRRRESAQADELRKVADEDLVALGDDIRALDIDVEMPNIDPRAKEQYAKALQAFEQASDGLRRATRPEDFRPISQTLEEGRYAMEAAKARLEGREPPEHRPPCFFDPRHGPSTRDVEWTPEYGAPRMVPACEADALRVEAGEDPHAREIEVAGQGRVPYWRAPAYYGPYAGGFFGGFGGAGVLGGLLAGSVLASAWDAPVAGADPGAGDWGGGDFGGDFGGGDFGGGDFGGGGDF